MKIEADSILIINANKRMKEIQSRSLIRNFIWSFRDAPMGKSRDT